MKNPVWTKQELDIYRAMTPHEKLELVARFYHDAKELKSSALRRQHPDWSDDKIEHMVKRIFLYGTG